jgi:NAD dependent epimerase/dehydratase family enzyme
MNDFATSIGKVLQRPSFFQVPKFILKIAVGEFADAIISGQKVSVDKLLKSGFNFRFADLENALKNLLNK